MLYVELKDQCYQIGEEEKSYCTYDLYVDFKEKIIHLLDSHGPLPLERAMDKDFCSMLIQMLRKMINIQMDSNPLNWTYIGYCHLSKSQPHIWEYDLHKQFEGVHPFSFDLTVEKHQAYAKPTDEKYFYWKEKPLKNRGSGGL